MVREGGGAAGAGGGRVRHTPLLCQTTAPEDKRRIIGDVFVRVAEHAVRDVLHLQEEQVLLGQGTLRPDLIESASSLASGAAAAIKTHHNDTELVRALRQRGRVVEPLKDFHKDEVCVSFLLLNVIVIVSCVYVLFFYNFNNVYQSVLE